MDIEEIIEVEEESLGLSDLEQSELSVRIKDDNEIIACTQLCIPVLDDMEDIKEHDLIVKFFDTVCCDLNCVCKFTHDEVKKFRSQSLTLDYYEKGRNPLEMILSAVIRCVHCKQFNDIQYGKNINNERSPTAFYLFKGIPVCEFVFIFVHAFTVERFVKLSSVVKSLDNDYDWDCLRLCTSILNENDSDEIKENNSIEKFFSTVCCSKKCNNKFTKEEMRRYRMQSQALDYYENGNNLLNTVMLGLIRSMYCEQSDSIVHSSKNKKMNNCKRKRVRANFFLLKGIQICKTAFMFAHAIKMKRFKRLLKVYKTNGLTERPHGNFKRKLRRKRPSQISMTKEDHLNAVTNQNRFL